MSIKISELGVSAPLTGNEDVPIVQNGGTVRTTTKGIADLVGLTYTAENVANKSSDTTLGTSDTLYPTQNAVKTYVDSATTSLIRDRGNFDASAGQFPATGGSGTGNSIMKGDLWYISVAGTLGGTSVLVGYSIRALVNNPGQNAANWGILNVGLGFVPENVANKSNDVNLGTSITLYPTQNAVKTYVDSHGGGLTSVGVQFGTSAVSNDLNVTSSPLTANGTITLNVPDASGGTTGVRGVVNTTTQSFKGTKTFEKIKAAGLQLDTTTTSYSDTGYTSLWSPSVSNYNVLNIKTGSGLASSLQLPNTGEYTYTFPASTGTLVLNSTLVGSYVPYTGGNQDLSLGNNNILGKKIQIDGSDGSFSFSQINGDGFSQYELNLHFKEGSIYNRMSISAYTDSTDSNYLKIFNRTARTKLIFPTTGNLDLNMPNTDGTLVVGGGLYMGGYLPKYDGSFSPTYKLSKSSIYEDAEGGYVIFDGSRVSIFGGVSPDNSSCLDLQSDSKGFLPPRMTESQRAGVSSPAIGLMVYQTNNTNGVYVYDGTIWRRLNWT